jgi:hypothetical protein
VSILFAAFLGYNPLAHLLGPGALASLHAHTRAVVTGRSFFPHLISGPFQSGLHEAFLFAICACLAAAGASALRGGRARPASTPAAGGRQQPGDSADGFANGRGADVRTIGAPRGEAREEQHAR